MKAETENAVRNVLAIDGEIEESVIERAISILKGQLEEKLPTIPYLSRKVVMKHLKCHRRTLDYYLQKGLLERVYRVGGVKAIGVSRESVMRFWNCAFSVAHHEAADRTNLAKRPVARQECKRIRH